MPEGDDIHSTPLGSLRVMNRVIEAGDAYALHKRLGEGSGGIGLPLATDMVKIKNLTGANRSRGAVVELGDYLLTSFSRDHLWLEGLTPSAQGVPNVAVLAFPTPENDLLDAHAAGVCLAIVNVVNVLDRFCYVKASEHRFTSAAIGHHRILNIPDNTGERLCVVALGGGVLSCLGTASGLIDTGDSVGVNVIAGTPGSEATTGQTVPACYNPGPPIYEGQQCTPAFLGGQLYVFPVECDP